MGELAKKVIIEGGRGCKEPRLNREFIGKGLARTLLILPVAGTPVAANRNGTMPPISRPITTIGVARSNDTLLPAASSAWV